MSQGRLFEVFRVFQECFNEVLFCNFVLAWISSQLPEQKGGLFFKEHKYFLSLVVTNVLIAILSLSCLRY